MTKKKNSVQQNIEVQIKKLMVLLRESDMPNEVQNSRIEILPKMLIEQIDQFIEILEAEYLN